MNERERQFLRDFQAFLAAPPASIETVRAQIDAFTDRLEAITPIAPRIGDFHTNVRLRDGLYADVAVPSGSGPHPVLLYLHGGGWVAGSPKSHRRLVQRFAEAGYLTVNLEYRLAPEHPFPAGYEDCVFAARWVRENAARWNGAADRIAIGGDSAGGNLAAAVAVGASNSLVLCEQLYESTLIPEEVVVSFSGSPAVAPAAPLAFTAVTVMVELTAGPSMCCFYHRSPLGQRSGARAGMLRSPIVCVRHWATTGPIQGSERLPHSGKLAGLGITAESGIIAA